MDKVTISNLQGESGLVNVIRYFLNNGSEYLIYSLNEVDESGYTRLYVTKMNGVDGNYTADTLNDSEWTEIKNLVKVIVKANKEKLPVPVQDINPKKIRNIVLKDKKIFKLNTPLVNDLAANKPNFDDDTSSGTQKNVFEVPSTPTFDTPVQPTFEVPNAPAFDTPVQPTFEVPSAPTFDTPVQPTFEVPSAPTFDTPVQPTFEVPSAPTFDTPVQPTFEVPSAPTFDTPVQPTFEVPNAPTFDTPVQPTFEIPSASASDIQNSAVPNYNTQQDQTNFGTFNFGATNLYGNTDIVTNNDGVSNSQVEELQKEIEKLNEELAKYKSIINNVKDIIEK